MTRTGNAPTERTRNRRLAEKGRYDRAALLDVLGHGFVCHLGVIVNGYPMVVPTVFGLDARSAGTDTIYLHGSTASRSLRTGSEVCMTVTHVDGLVLARSVFEHGVNYRCAMIYGVPRVVTDPDEKLHGLRCVSEQAAPGQWDYARAPSRKELAATTLLALTLDEASVKISAGPPDDGSGPDGTLDVWAGELPLTTVFGVPRADPALRPGIPVPPHIAVREGTAP